MYRIKIFLPDTNPYTSLPQEGAPRKGLNTRMFGELIEREFNAGLSMGCQQIHHDDGRTFLDVYVLGDGDSRMLDLGKYACETRNVKHIAPDRSFRRLEALAQQQGVELELVAVPAEATV